MLKLLKSKFKRLALKMMEIVCENMDERHQHRVDRTTLYVIFSTAIPWWCRLGILFLSFSHTHTSLLFIPSVLFVQAFSNVAQVETCSICRGL